MIRIILRWYWWSADDLTVDQVLSSTLYLLGSGFEVFPFWRVLSLELPKTAGRLRFDHKLCAIVWITWSISGSSHFFSSSGSTLLLAFPDFNWQRCFWISSMVGISWLMRKLFEIFCSCQANSGRLPLSSMKVAEQARLVGLKCSLKWSKIFSRGHFLSAGFKVDSCFLGQEKSI